MNGYVILNESVTKLISNNAISALAPNGVHVDFDGAHKYLSEVVALSKPVHATFAVDFGSGLTTITLVGAPFSNAAEARGVSIAFVSITTPTSLACLFVSTNNTTPNELLIKMSGIALT